MKTRILLSLALFLLSGSLLFSHEETRDLRLSAAGIETIKIECGAGFLKVQGDDSIQAIEVKAEIILKGKSEEDAQKYLDKYLRLTLEKKGDRAELNSYFTPKFGIGSWQSKQINLTVIVPADLELLIEDGSGEMRIWDVEGLVKIDDGSGDIELEDLGGDVWIDDGSGSIEVRDVTGNITIKDGSGSMKIENIKGNVQVDDGSGSISVRDVEGDFNLVDDGSGGLNISGVSGQVKKR